MNNKLPEKEFKVQGRISDFSVDDGRLHGAEKRWYQQTFKTMHLSDPQVRLVPDAEELAEDFEENKFYEKDDSYAYKRELNHRKYICEPHKGL